MLERMRTGGAASIRHKAIGRPSNNRISDGVRDYAMTLVRGADRGFVEGCCRPDDVGIGGTCA
jgi:hypothetical protein